MNNTSDPSDPKEPGDFVPLSDERDVDDDQTRDDDDTAHGETNIPPAPP